MEDEIIIEEGVANEFKSNMQKTYDYLNDCDTSLSNCSILEELGFDGGNNAAYKSSIDETKGEITSLLSQVMRCEEDLISLDEHGSERLTTVFENEEPEVVKEEPKQEEQPVVPQEESQDSGSNDNGNRTYSGGSGGGNYGGGYVAPVTTPTTTETTHEENYKFSIDRDTAYNAGDIFIDDYDHSLTKFTNDLLEKYGIKNEKVAKKVYESVINYGKKYYSEHQSNPITSVSEEEILNALYEELKDLVSDSTKETFWDLLKNVTL